MLNNVDQYQGFHIFLLSDLIKPWEVDVINLLSEKTQQQRLRKVTKTTWLITDGTKIPPQDS